MNVFFLVFYGVGSFFLFSEALDRQSWWCLAGGLWGTLNAHAILMRWAIAQEAALAAKEEL